MKLCASRRPRAEPLQQAEVVPPQGEREGAAAVDVVVVVVEAAAAAASPPLLLLPPSIARKRRQQLAPALGGIRARSISASARADARLKNACSGEGESEREREAERGERRRGEDGLIVADDVRGKKTKVKRNDLCHHHLHFLSPPPPSTQKQKKKVVPDGIEPPALALLVPRSNQLSYGTEREGATERERKGEGTTSLMWASNVGTQPLSHFPYFRHAPPHSLRRFWDFWVYLIVYAGGEKERDFFFPSLFSFFSSLSSNFSFFHCKSV